MSEAKSEMTKTEPKSRQQSEDKTPAAARIWTPEERDKNIADDAKTRADEAKDRAKVASEEQGHSVAPAGLVVDSEGQFWDPAESPHSGQTVSLKLAEEDKLREAEAIETRRELWEEARTENEADNSKLLDERERVKEALAEEAREWQEALDKDAEQAQKEYREMVGLPEPPKREEVEEAKSAEDKSAPKKTATASK